MSTAEARLEVHRKVRAYLAAHEAAAKACDARSSLPPGSTRAKATSANARWASAAEERDRLYQDLPPDLASALFQALTHAEQNAP